MGLERVLENEGVEPVQASIVAKWLVRNDIGFFFHPAPLQGFSLFDVRNDHGTVRILLNQDHRLYQLMVALQQGEDMTEASARDACQALYLLLCAWARMFDQTSNTQARQRLQKIVWDWGNEANHMLSTLSQRLINEE